MLFIKTDFKINTLVAIFVYLQQSYMKGKICLIDCEHKVSWNNNVTLRFHQFSRHGFTNIGYDTATY